MTKSLLTCELWLETSEDRELEMEVVEEMNEEGVEEPEAGVLTEEVAWELLPLIVPDGDGPRAT